MLSWGQKATINWMEKLERGVERSVGYRLAQGIRRHGGQAPNTTIDLPYSNFAYDQKGTPWPVNQAVYVDYMLYDLRGYHDISAEEIAAIFRNNQEPSGHVGGYANWGVYTPSMS